MANREVNLTKRVQTPHGWRYCRVVLSANGRVKPDVVVVNGKEERHPEGAYYLEWREGSKRVRLSVGKDPADASARRLRKEAELNAVNNGVTVVPDGQNGHRSLAAAVAEFLDETKLTKKPKTLAAYTTALNYFTESCHKQNLHEVDRRDLLKFSAFLRDEKEQAPRSVYNKFENVMTFLKANGIRGLAGKNDWPRYTEEEPEIYEPEELDKLLVACDAEERLWYEFFLMTGMREQEVMYTYLVGHQRRPRNRACQPQARPGMDAEGVQRARDSDSCETSEKPKGMESQGRQDMWSGVPHCRLQAEARLPRLPESRGRACEARPRQLLASQVPCNVRDAVSLGRCRSPYGSAMAWSLRHGIDDAIFEAVTQPACTE